MEIIKNKIKLRAIEKSDLYLLKSMMNSSDIEQSLGGWSFPVSDFQQETWFEAIQNMNTQTTLRLIIDVDGTAIGTIILTDIDMKNGTAQIHIKMMQQKKKGYGSQSIMMLCEYAFKELRLNTIYSMVNENNIPSQKTFNKCGFVKEGILRSRVYKRGVYHNVISYSLGKKDLINEQSS